MKKKLFLIPFLGLFLAGCSFELEDLKFWNYFLKKDNENESKLKYEEISKEQAATMLDAIEKKELTYESLPNEVTGTYVLEHESKAVDEEYSNYDSEFKINMKTEFIKDPFYIYADEVYEGSRYKESGETWGYLNSSNEYITVINDRIDDDKYYGVFDFEEVKNKGLIEQIIETEKELLQNEELMTVAKQFIGASENTNGNIFDGEFVYKGAGEGNLLIEYKGKIRNETEQGEVDFSSSFCWENYFMKDVVVDFSGPSQTTITTSHTNSGGETETTTVSFMSSMKGKYEIHTEFKVSPRYPDLVQYTYKETSQDVPAVETHEDEDQRE